MTSNRRQPPMEDDLQILIVEYLHNHRTYLVFKSSLSDKKSKIFANMCLTAPVLPGCAWEPVSRLPHFVEVWSSLRSLGVFKISNNSNSFSIRFVVPINHHLTSIEFLLTKIENKKPNVCMYIFHMNCQ